MPIAFHHAGYIVGSISTVIIAISAVYCIHMLIAVHHELCKRKRVSHMISIEHIFQLSDLTTDSSLKNINKTQVPSLEYPKIAEAALLEGPKWMHKFAPHIM